MMRAMTIYPIVALLGLGTLGCEGTRHASPLITEYDENQASAELDFWHGLADEPVTTNNDAFHGLIELANETDPNTSYEQRVAWLTEQGLLDEGFDRPGDQAVLRGTVAQILCRILDIRGGLTMHLIGAHPRYATRELVFLEIMQPGTEQQALSGIEFVGTVSRAQDYDGRSP